MLVHLKRACEMKLQEQTPKMRRPLKHIRGCQMVLCIYCEIIGVSLDFLLWRVSCRVVSSLLFYRLLERVGSGAEDG